jgi:hypothetical protein
VPLWHRASLELARLPKAMIPMRAQVLAEHGEGLSGCCGPRLRPTAGLAKRRGMRAGQPQSFVLRMPSFSPAARSAAMSAVPGCGNSSGAVPERLAEPSLADSVTIRVR